MPDPKSDRPSFYFKLVDEAHRALVLGWLVQPHVAEWFYGEGLKNTMEQLDAFLHGSSIFQYWLGLDKNLPFALFITSFVSKPRDELTKWCTEKGEAITLDMLIGDLNYLGKRLLTSTMFCISV